MSDMADRARTYADNWNRSFSRDSYPTEKRTYAFEGSSENLDTLETMLCFIQYLGNVGHSTSFEVFVDGDGAARMKFKDGKGKDLDKVNGNSEKVDKKMDQDHNIKSFGLD